MGISLALHTFDLAHGSVSRCLRRPAPGAGIVLYYHAIKQHQRCRFARQMDQILQQAHLFDAGLPETMIGKGPNVAVTFDDGFQSVVENALPELAKRRIPFTVFVPSGCLGERPSWVRDSSHAFWDERVLSAADLRALAAVPLATLGSHSVTHRNLRDLDPGDAEQELVGSKAQLTRVVGAPIELFSFPHGAHDAALIDRARQAGYRRVFTIEPRRVEADSEGFALGRVAASPDDWSIEFRLKIVGAYRWRQHWHRIRRAA